MKNNKYLNPIKFALRLFNRVKIIPLSLGVIVLSLFAAYLLHAVWTPPTVDPPAGFVSPPVTGVTAGSGLTGGGHGGVIPLAVGTGAITAGHIATNAVGSAEIANNTIMTWDIMDGQVTSADIAGDTITHWDIATGAVRSTEILDGTITAADLAPGVGGGDITAVHAGSGLTGGGTVGNVTLNVGTGAITAGHIATNAVGHAEIASGAVRSTEIMDGHVTSADIADGHVTAADIGTNAVGAAEIVSGAVRSTEIMDGQVTSADIANHSIQAHDLAFTPGDITRVRAGSGLTGGGWSGDVTLNIGAGDDIVVTGNTVGLDQTLVIDSLRAGSVLTVGTNLCAPDNIRQWCYWTIWSRVSLKCRDGRFMAGAEVEEIWQRANIRLYCCEL